MNPLKIDLYADIVCPWCYLGQYRLDKVLSEHFSDITVDIEHHPVILMPDCPSEGLNIDDLLKARYGKSIDRITRLQAEAEASNLMVDFRRQSTSYPTIGGHTLIRLARPRGTQHTLAAALHAAYFRDVQNIGDPQVLADIAVQHGFERADAIRLSQDRAEQSETLRATERSRAKGVSSVPHFFFAGTSAGGGKSEADFVATIQSALAVHR
ncbi:DsbA family protein [Rhizobium sp. ICMP 5592]|uniref:DsbA family protein n=1 Tax=Rhizobium sp. ICMP 5592 TaxID=2292445 RepID=UPI001294BE71|nr:DsbA family protein [Rhizobium sp. ICMP 5592]MQB46139.1 DsbA family protein [Rhizobium sp. ICMP 5592]